MRKIPLEFCDKIKLARKKLRLSQHAFAKELGIAYVTLNRLENERFHPSYDTQKRFEEFCARHNINILELGGASVNQVDLGSSDYNEWSSYYDKSNNEIRSIIESLKETPWLNKRVLEVGCGTGRFTEKIISQVSTLTAVDIDSGHLDILKKKAASSEWGSKCKIILGELYDLAENELSDEKFDCVLFTWSWRFIYQQGKADRVYKAVKKLLAPSASILSTMTIGGQWEDAIDRIVGTRESDREINMNRAANQYLIDILKKDGFCNTDFIQTNYFEFPSMDVAQRLALEMSGVGDERKEKVMQILSGNIGGDGKVRFSDVIQCIYAKSDKREDG